MDLSSSFKSSSLFSYYTTCPKFAKFIIFRMEPENNYDNIHIEGSHFQKTFTLSQTLYSKITFPEDIHIISYYISRRYSHYITFYFQKIFTLSYITFQKIFTLSHILFLEDIHIYTLHSHYITLLFQALYLILQLQKVFTLSQVAFSEDIHITPHYNCRRYSLYLIIQLQKIFTLSYQCGGSRTF